MPEYIYVIGKDGKPQMPTKRQRHVQRLLNAGKARIAEHVPFTIQLLYENKPVLQPVTVGIDPGRTSIGAAAVSDKGEVLFSAVAETRNKEIRKLMSDRAAYRRASRNGERKARQRLAKRFKTMLKAGMVMRKLPNYGEEGFITCKYIRNTEARFSNRRRPKGWVTPTVEQLIRTHINLVHKVQKFLPVTDVALEINRFAFMLMEDPSAAGIDFQNGPLKGFDNVNAAVRDLQHGKCLLCGKPITQYHHVIPKSQGGSDTFQNITGLCDDCHETVHKDAKALRSLQTKQKGLLKKYAALSALNQAIPFIYKRLEEAFENRLHYSTGLETYIMRKSFEFEKTKDNPLHEVDAYCIALQNPRIVHKPPVFGRVYRIRQFRRQDRAIINNTRERTYYLDGKIVAKNRKARFGQKGDSLAAWFEKMVQEHGLREAERMRSRLTVRPSTRYYNTPGRLMPGAVFYYKGERKVLTAQYNYGKYFRVINDTKEYARKDCRIAHKNAGLVFVG